MTFSERGRSSTIGKNSKALFGMLCLQHNPKTSLWTSLFRLVVPSQQLTTQLCAAQQEKYFGQKSQVGIARVQQALGISTIPLIPYLIVIEPLMAKSAR